MRKICPRSGIFWCLILILSCTSKHSISPHIDFVNPELNSLHDLRTDLEVEIDISDDMMILEYKFWLESESGFEFFYEKKEVNNSTHKILYRFDLSENINGDFSIRLEVKDDDGNKTERLLKVSTF